jgi:hypothetical protein
MLHGPKMQLDMTTLAWTAWTTGRPESVFSPQGPAAELHLDVTLFN